MSPSLRTHQVSDTERELETIVLTQLRDSMALVNANMSKLADKIDETNIAVTVLSSAKYDTQIEKLAMLLTKGMELEREERVKQDEALWERLNKQGDLVAAQAVQIARLGLGMAISATVGGTSLGAVIVLIINKTLGGH